MIWADSIEMGDTDHTSTSTAIADDQAPSSFVEYGLLPALDCFLTLTMSHNRFQADTGTMTASGLPSVYDGVSLSTVLGKNRKLHVQVPKAMLCGDVDHMPDLTVLEQVKKRDAIANKVAEAKALAIDHPRKITLTFFDMIEGDLVGVQTRKYLNDVIRLLFEGRGVQSPQFLYPVCNVLSTPQWATCKLEQYASSPVKWATISFISPLPKDSTLEDTQTESEKKYLSSLHGDETSEDIVTRLHPPDQQSKDLMQRFLSHLDSRGILWTKAGQVTVPSKKNRSPRQRPEFVVLGLFPKSFLARCKTFYKKCQYMSSDVKEDANSKYAPLIMHPNSKASNGSVSTSTDLLEGWYVRTVTEEPFKPGGISDDSAQKRNKGGLSVVAFYGN